MAPTGGHKDPSDGDLPSLRRNLHIVALRNKVVFPQLPMALDLSRKIHDQVMRLLAANESMLFGTVALRPGAKTDPAIDVAGALFEVGTLCEVIKPPRGSKSEVADGKHRLFVRGLSRFKVLECTKTEVLPMATVEIIEDLPITSADEVTVRALVQRAQDMMSEIVRTDAKDGDDAKRSKSSATFRWPSSPVQLSSIVGATVVQLTVEERQQILETLDHKERLELVLDLLQREMDAKTLHFEMIKNFETSRAAEVNEMMLQRRIQEVKKSLQKLKSKASDGPSGAEAGNTWDPDADADEQEELAALAERLQQAGLHKEAEKIAVREMRRLKNMQPQHPEYTVTHTYLELLASLPWTRKSEDRFDIHRARAILDEEHCGLEKVKHRILEFLAVQKLRGNMKGPILCLHGPPGIGKTSLGRSVARALGRKFHRIALGGVRDEAELRGHRRTYIGSIPGVIIQAFQSLGVNNPVILLDEVDKVSGDAAFNAQATLLEILDPEQNESFRDHYLNTPFDLSRVLFICTANDLSLMQGPLIDRMEVVDLAGYTVDEKVSIATTHLLPKQRRLHALQASVAPVTSDDRPMQKSSSSDAPPQEEPRLVLSAEAVTSIITNWTAESGVRSLERELAKICRWAALRLQGINMRIGIGSFLDAEREDALRACGPNEKGQIVVDAQHLQYVLGGQLYSPDVAERLTVGVAMGLSVSSTGGHLLFIEATRAAKGSRDGTGLLLTGQLGSVMTESVSTALSLLRSRCLTPRHGTPSSSSGNIFRPLPAPRFEPSSSDDKLGDPRSDDRDPFRGETIHVHFPAGAIPKDGPSAGVAIVLAMASLLLNRPMRNDTAMTGEVTLRGHVLPVGGIRDKVLAAHRAGVRHVLLPLANKRHAEDEIPARRLTGIELHYIKHIDEALEWAFGRGGHGMRTVGASALAAPVQVDLPPGVPAAAAAALARSCGTAGGDALPPTWSRL